MPDGSVPSNGEFGGAATYIAASESESLFAHVEKIAEIEAPEILVPAYTQDNRDSEGRYYNSNWTGMQGGYFDGTYFYQTFIKYCYSNPGEVYDAGNIVKIVKYDVSGDEPILVKESEPFGYPGYSESLYHANDITIDSDGNLLVVNGYEVIKLNPTDLSYVGKVVCVKSLYGIDYNQSKEQYVLGIGGTTGFLTADTVDDWKILIATAPSGISEANAYTKQGLSSDGEYVYCLYYGNGVDKTDGTGNTKLTSDAVIVYDLQGNFVTFIEVNFGNEEPENISVVNGDIYVTTATGSSAPANLYKVTNLIQGTKVVRR